MSERINQRISIPALVSYIGTKERICMDKKRLLMLVEIAIFAAIGLVLDQVSFKVWAQGALLVSSWYQ